MNELGLKKIAFVAMPFGVKPTGLAPGKGPAEIDFDALWDKAIFPALSDLNFLPIRADNQTGSVIIKDMLEQLVFADLVLADVSIPNGNVYYEAGVRHAARDTGCILISADWARPLFDLAQITSLRYPFPENEPTDDDYKKIVDRLVAGIPPLTQSVGPVFALTKAGSAKDRDTRQLKEISSLLFEFQKNLRAAELTAADGNRARLREIVRTNDLGNLPAYALEELVGIARDNLEWAELAALIDKLPESVLERPFFLEQKALALSKQGKVHDAIAMLDTVIEKFGETPERLGTIGSRYLELAGEEANRTRKRRHQAKAIDAYRLGMTLDLNQYYCAYKLIVALMDRGRSQDQPEAERCAQLVKAAAERARSMGREDEWLDSTMAVLAFFEQDYELASETVDRILDQGWANWKLVGLSEDLKSALSWIDKEDRPPFHEIFDELLSSLPIEQDVLMDEVLPLIRAANKQYKKFQQVHARPATPGETITSVTDDGEETTNTAGADDMIVRNLTEAEEMYIVGKKKFMTRYAPLEPVDGEWTLYDPLGEVMALEITRELTDRFNVGEAFYIIAPWGSEQLAREGDKLVSPLPDLDEVYRIARKEFGETYQLKSAD
jgi:hypothetical protein